MDQNSKKYKKTDLRRGVNHFGVTCVFFCHDGKGNILLHKRSSACRDEQGRWDCGAGAMEFGETFEDAVQREVKEEYGVTPRAVRFVGTSNVLRKNGGIDTHWVELLFAVRVDPKKARIGEPDKMDEIGWFHHTSIPTPAHSVLHKHLQMVKESGEEFF